MIAHTYGDFRLQKLKGVNASTSQKQKFKVHFTSSAPLLILWHLTDNFHTHILGRYAESAWRDSV